MFVLRRDPRRINCDVQQKRDNVSCESCFWRFKETIRDVIGVVRCRVVGEWELGGSSR